jgi:hypothetical protein
MENESEKELNVADSTVVDETTEEENSLEFTDTEEEENENPSSTEGDDSNEETSEISEEDVESETEKHPQTSEENSKYAAARRKAEKAKYDKAYEEGRLSAYKGKINPYTNTKIEDLTDVEVYEDMYKIAEDGKDPLKDYASYTADKRREEARIEKEKLEKESKAQQEIEEFSKKYPDVNISSLLKDEMFLDYAEGKNKTLVDTYESFSKFKRSFRNEGIKTAKKTIANSISTPGSLNQSSDNTPDYESMSREQFLKELEKVKEGF